MLIDQPTRTHVRIVSKSKVWSELIDLINHPSQGHAGTVSKASLSRVDRPSAHKDTLEPHQRSQVCFVLIDHLSTKTQDVCLRSLTEGMMFVRQKERATRGEHGSSQDWVALARAGHSGVPTIIPFVHNAAQSFCFVYSGFLSRLRCLDFATCGKVILLFYIPSYCSSASHQLGFSS